MKRPSESRLRTLIQNSKGSSPSHAQFNHKDRGESKDSIKFFRVSSFTSDDVEGQEGAASPFNGVRRRMQKFGTIFASKDEQK